MYFVLLAPSKHAIIDESERELELIRKYERKLRRRLIDMGVQEKKMTIKVNRSAHGLRMFYTL